MSEEIRVRIDVRDYLDREHTCEVSSSSGMSVVSSTCGSQIELVRLLAEAFRVVAHHLVAPPDDNLLLEKFAEASLDWNIKIRNSDELSEAALKDFAN